MNNPKQSRRRSALYLITILLTPYTIYTSLKTKSFSSSISEYDLAYLGANVRQLPAHVVPNRLNEYARTATFRTPDLRSVDVLVVPSLNATGKHLAIGSGAVEYVKTHESDKTWTCYISSCYIQAPMDLRGDRAQFECQHWPTLLRIPFVEGAPLALCDRFPILNQLITAADDARLWLSDDGVPMIIFFSSLPNSCRGMSIIDARAVVPGLADLMKENGFDVPMRFEKPFRLEHAGQSEIEKNWAHIPSSTEHLRFMTNIVPIEAVEVDLGNERLVSLARHSDEKNSCLLYFVYDTLGVEANHLGTPFLRFKACRRGKCPPNADTAMFSIINRKREDFLYDSRVVVTKAKPPYKTISISSPLTFAGTPTDQFAWIHGLSWVHPSFENKELVGYLDDMVYIHITIQDIAAVSTAVTVGELLTHQMKCP